MALSSTMDRDTSLPALAHDPNSRMLAGPLPSLTTFILQGLHCTTYCTCTCMCVWEGLLWHAWCASNLCAHVYCKAVERYRLSCLVTWYSVTDNLFPVVFPCPVSLIELSPDVQLMSSAVKGLGDICRCGPLPLPRNSTVKGELSKMSIIESLAGKLKVTTDAKVRQDKWHGLSLALLLLRLCSCTNLADIFKL